MRSVQFPGPDEEIDTEGLFVGLCRHCRVLRASTAAELRAGAKARSRAARLSAACFPPSAILHAAEHAATDAIKLQFFLA